MSKKSMAEVLAPKEVPVESLIAVVDRQMDMLRSYKARQDDTVISLGQIQKVLKLGACEAALSMIDDLMAHDLKQSKERVGEIAASMVNLLLLINDLLDHVEVYEERQKLFAQFESIKKANPEAFSWIADIPKVAIN